MRNTARPVARRPLAAAIFVVLATSAVPAFAQQATPPQAPAADAEETAASARTLDAVTVTGSRIPRAGFDTLEPATVLGGESIRERGMINVADALNQTTGFGLAQTPEGTQGNYAVGVNFVNRFGLGSNRTLTLINGRRVVTSRAATNFGYAAGMQVDLNAIPAQLVDRVENLTIGGAPTYGSDAIAGTVNIILKDHYEGGEVNFNYGQTAQENSRTLGYSFVFGQNFADDRGNWVLSGNYANIEGLMQSENDFYRRSLAYLANSASVATCGPNDGRLDPGIPCNAAGAAGLNDGVPASVIFRDLRTYTSTFGGLILPDNVAGTGEGPAISNLNQGLVGFGPGGLGRYRFDNDGRLVAYDQGIFHSTTSATGGDGLNPTEVTGLLQDQKRHAVNLLGHFDLTDNVRLFWEGTYYNSVAGGPGGSANTITNATTASDKNEGLRVRADHPLLTDAARQTLASLGVTGSSTFRMNRVFRDLGTQAETSEGTINRWVLGANGYFDIGARSLDWEVAANFGRMHARNAGPALNHQKFMNAINNCQTAIQYIGLTDPSNRTLFSTLTSDPDCVPLDPFGEGRASQAARDYVMDVRRTEFLQEEQVYSAFAHMDVAELWAGPLAVALGVEHRREEALFENDAFSRQGLGRTVGLNDLHGKFHTNEYYAEVLLPLASADNDIPGLHRLDLIGKIRRVDNSEVGGFNAYTYGLQWEPIAGLQFRGNRTKSLRAPSIVELFLEPVELFQTATDVCNFNQLDNGPNPAIRRRNCEAMYASLGLPATFQQPTTSVRAFRQGNPDLLNESADSWTAGVVWTPEFIKGLSLAIDYNVIELSDQILALSSLDVLTACYDDANFNLADPANGNSYCSLLTRRAGPYNAATNPTAGQFDPFRLAYVNGEFINFSAWTGELAYRWDAGNAGVFNFAANAIVRTRHEVKNTPVSVVDNLVGELSFPKQQYRVTAAWAKGDFGLHAGMRYTSSVMFDDTETVESRAPLTVPSYRLYNAGVSYRLGDYGLLRFNVDNLTDQEPEGVAMSGVNGVGDYDVLGRRYMLSYELKFR